MARYEFGWFKKKLYFTKQETEDAADIASAAAVLGAVVPDPVLSKVFAAYAGVVAVMAKRATRKGQALGLMWLGLSPFPMHAPIPFVHDEEK
ncbi:hypothetical protein AB0I02_29515 [Streptomyces phaeochromogenes]